jgi:hypothetical protein
MQLLVVFACTLLVLPVEILMSAVLITNKTGGKLNICMHGCEVNVTTLHADKCWGWRGERALVADASQYSKSMSHAKW